MEREAKEKEKKRREGWFISAEVGEGGGRGQTEKRVTAGGEGVGKERERWLFH